VSWPNTTSWLMVSGCGKLISTDRVRWKFCNLDRDVVTLLNGDPEVWKLRRRVPAAKERWKIRRVSSRAVSQSNKVVNARQKPSPFCCTRYVHLQCLCKALTCHKNNVIKSHANKIIPRRWRRVKKIYT